MRELARCISRHYFVEKIAARRKQDGDRFQSSSLAHQVPDIFLASSRWCPTVRAALANTKRGSRNFRPVSRDD